MPTLQFWFEYGSTYTYLSVMRIAGLASARGVTVDWRPFLLTPILAAQGMSQGPFLPFPSKLRYMWRDLERRARKHGLPYRRPSTYPPNTLLTARIGVLAAAEVWCQAFTERTFELHWVKDQPIGTECNLEGTLTSVGKDVNDLVARAQAPESKEALRRRPSALSRWGCSARRRSSSAKNCSGAMIGWKRRSTGLWRRGLPWCRRPRHVLAEGAFRRGVGRVLRGQGLRRCTTRTTVARQQGEG